MRARAKASLVACSALLLLRLLFFVPEESAVRQARPSLRSSLVIFDDAPSLAPAPAHSLQPAQRSVSAPMRSAARDTSPAGSGSEARTATVAAQSSGSRWGDQRATTFAQYVTLQHAFMNPPPGAKSVRVPGLNNETRPLRYLVVKPCCQLCNRLRVLLSAVALGILTERAVVMDFDRDYYGKFTDLFASPLSPLRAEPPKGVPGAKRVRSLGWLHCMQGFLCDDPLQWPEAVVAIEGAPSFLHTIWLNPKLRPRFKQAFGDDPSELFADLFWSLLPPQPKLLRAAQDFLEQLPRETPTTAAPISGGGSQGGEGGQSVRGGEGGGEGGARPFVVGMHVRNGRDFRSQKLTAAEWERLAECAAALLPGPGTARQRVRRTVFVVATESAESRAAASAALGGAATFYETALPKGQNGSVSREGARRSLVELLIVAQSDGAVLTPMSSFSEAAAAIGRRPGVYYHFDARRKFHHESAVEVRRGCFVPWTSEMPGSMDLHTVLDKLPCAAAVREADHTLWSHPKGLQFLDGTSAMPDTLARKVSSY